MQTTIDALPNSATRSGFGVRLGAMLIDIVIVTGIAFVVGPFLGGILGAAAGSAATNGSSDAAAVGGVLGMIAGLVIAVPVVYFLYFLLEAFAGITLGKLILGIRVGTDSATYAGVSSLVVRFLIKSSGSLLSLLAIVAGVGILGTVGQIASLIIFVGCFLVLGAKKQSIHDMLSKTAVYPKSQLK